MAKEETYKEIERIVVAKRKKFSDAEVLTPDDLRMGVLEVEQAIKNYCQIPCVIPQLNYIWANMVVDLLLFQYESNITPDDSGDMSGAIDVSDISSVKVGDTSVFLGDKYRSNLRSRILQSHDQAQLDDIVMNYRQQLNQFRRLL